MLSSIHPLGERVRHNRWGFTAASYVSGALLAGAALGLLLGLGGAVLDAAVGAATVWIAAVVAVAGLIGAAVDLSAGGLALPSLWPRQVDDHWLNRYRGWVYGAGFGLQLGLGVATFVTTAAVYVTWLIAFSTASPWAGATIGATFGLVRGSVIFTMAGVQDAAGLRRAHRRLDAWAGPARIGAAAGQAALALVVAVGLVAT